MRIAEVKAIILTIYNKKSRVEPENGRIATRLCILFPQISKFLPASIKDRVPPIRDGKQAHVVAEGEQVDHNKHEN